MSESIFDRLCPFITDDAVLGKVSWNDRCGAFEAAVTLWGTARVPLLLSAFDPVAQYEARLRRDAGALRPVSIVAAELAPTLIERGKDVLPKIVALENAARLVASKPAREDEPPSRLKPHVGSVQVFATHTLVWLGSKDDSVCVKLDLIAGNAVRTSADAAKASAMFTRVPEGVLELPTHHRHPLLGDLTLSVRAAQYIGVRNDVVLRVDLGESVSRKTLDALLDRAGTLLQKVEAQYTEVTERVMTAVRERRADRDKTAPKSVRLAWAALLERQEAMLFFESEPKADDAISATFNPQGRLRSIDINTNDEPFTIEVAVGPVAPSAPEQVEHPKFGAGVVVERVEGGKARVRFADGSERTLLASVLRPKT
jgi:hypothetical protein